MRKPLVVACGVAVAVLIAGGITATTAGADTTPDMPSLPGFELPDLTTFPHWPASDDRDGTDQDGTDQDGTDQNGDGDNDQDRTGSDDAGQSADDQVDQNLAAGQDAAGQDAAGQDAAGQDVAGQDVAGQDAADQDAADQDLAADQDQAPQRPGGALGDHARPAAQRPAQPQPARLRPAQQRPAATVLAAAQREVSPSSVSLSPAAPVQQQVLALVNENRRRGGCGTLTLDRRLISAAYRHAADMARRGYFAHESPSGAGAGDRVQDAGYEWSRYGENIARGQESPYEVVDGWMHSQVHRENIMDCRLDQMGIGLAFSSDRQPYWVQDFATPRS